MKISKNFKEITYVASMQFEKFLESDLYKRVYNIYKQVIHEKQKLLIQEKDEIDVKLQPDFDKLNKVSKNKQDFLKSI